MKISSKISKIQGYKFKSKSKRLGLLLACLCILMIGFQNCLNQPSNRDTASAEDPTPATLTPTTPTPSNTTTTSSTITVTLSQRAKPTLTISPSSDTTPKSSITWTWECADGESCTYAYITTSNLSTPTFTDDQFGSTQTTAKTYNTNECSTPTCDYYLYVQAKRSSDNVKSDVQNASVVLGHSLPQAQIAIGMWHACYLKGGGVKCWGNNARGQLGLTAGTSDSNYTIGDVPNEMENLQPITLKGRAIAIDAAEGALWNDCDDSCSEEAEGTARDQCVEDCAKANHDRQGLHTCALLENGKVKCWGSNRYGQLGLGHSNNIGDQANEITNLPAVDLGHNAKTIAVGNRHTCALLNNDHIKCWGANNRGQLGYGTKGGSIGNASGEMGSNLSFVGGNNFKAKAISAGRDFTCAIMTDDNVKCWGLNTSGQLGQDHEEAIGDNSNEVSNLNAIRLNQGAKAITTGAYHACAVLTDDSAKCWGYNAYGQLGQGHRRSIGNNSGEIVGLQAIGFGSNLTVKAIQAGTFHTCALLSDDNMRCWGAQ